MRVLLVVSRWPWPARRGDELRTGQTIAALGGAHALTVLAPASGGASPAGLPAAVVTYRPPPFAARLLGLARCLASGAPLQNALFASADLELQTARLAAAADVVVLQLARLGSLASVLAPRPLVIDFIDSLGRNLASRARRDRLLLRPLWRVEAARLARLETALLRQARVGLVVSARDRQALSELAPEVAGRLRVVPMAFDLAAREPRPELPPAPRVVFTGNLGYFPNREAASYLLSELWPAISRRCPGTELVLAGDRPPPALRRRAREAGATLLVAPPSLDAVLATATIALAPLGGGSGTPLKILEAWRAGVPVVASPEAATNLGAQPGVELLVASSPAEWVETVAHLLANAEARAALVAAGRARLAREHSSEQVSAAWREALRAALASA